MVIAARDSFAGDPSGFPRNSGESRSRPPCRTALRSRGIAQGGEGPDLSRKAQAMKERHETIRRDKESRKVLCCRKGIEHLSAGKQE